MRATGIAFGLLAALLTMSGVASAESKGFALNRFDPSERGSDWFSTDSLDLRGSNRFGVGIVGDWAHKPLVLYDNNDNELSAFVKEQMFVHVGASWVLADRLRIAFNLPVAVLNDGEGELNGMALSTGAGIGDVRASLDLRLVGEYGGAFTLAFGAQVHIPTGKQDAFTGDEKLRIVPRLQAAGDVGVIAYSARLAPNIRLLNDDFDGQPFGTEFQFGAAVGARLADGKLLIGPEVFGSSVFSGFFEKKTTPFELVVGGHYKFTDSWRAGVGVGPGLTQGFGTPQLRVLASIEWYDSVDKVEKAEPTKADTDGDGFLDDEDACPNEPGVANDDPEKNGCPLPPDRDGDGIPDAEDACPDEPGVRSDVPAKNGCPIPPDRDKDGIPDAQDACPDEAGVASDDPSKHGCPIPPDRDKDGIIDSEDACPDDAGPPNSDPNKHGCPKAVVIGSEIKIMERVEFDTNKATIRPESNGLLSEVLEILQKHPDITLVSVEGHTDDRGGAPKNLKLSKSRAASVVSWLTAKGIESSRLTSQGFGQTKPIDTNKTEAGRQNNRRVEFQILERTPKE